MLRALCLTVFLSLCGSGMALTPIPALPADWHVPRSSTNAFQDGEAYLVQNFPEYIGFNVWNGTLYLALDTDDPVRQQRLLSYVLQAQAEFLNVLGYRSGSVVFLTPPKDPVDLGAIYAVTRQFNGMTFTQGAAHSRIQRYVIGLQDRSQEPAARKAFEEAGISSDAYLLVSGTQHGLMMEELAPELSGPFTARIDLPAVIHPGDTVPSTVKVRNTGTNPLTFDLGNCAPPAEIRNARTGELVVGIPWMVACAGVGVMVTLQPAEENVLSSWTWQTKYPDGRPLPPGRYVLRVAVTGVSEGRPGNTGPLGSVVPPAIEFDISP